MTEEHFAGWTTYGDKSNEKKKTLKNRNKRLVSTGALTIMLKNLSHKAFELLEQGLSWDMYSVKDFWWNITRQIFFLSRQVPV